MENTSTASPQHESSLEPTQEAKLDQGANGDGTQSNKKIAPSPFIASTKLQFAWDSTSLGALKECPRKYQYSIIEGWRSKSTKVDLEFGIEYHHGIEVYDRVRLQGESHEEALRFVVKDILTRTWEAEWAAIDDPNKNRQTLIRSLIWYLEEFQNDNAKTITLANGKPAVELSFRMNLDYGPLIDETPGMGPNYMLCGHIDRLVTFIDQVYVQDHKTTKTTLSPNYFAQFEPDNQMSLYTIASQIVWSTPVKGVMIDAAQIAVGFTKFDRSITYRTEAQLEEWLQDLQVWLRQNEEYVRQDHWPMNDKSCRMCQFKKICSKDPSVREIFLKSEFDNSNPWNPLRIR